jgi:hypothetical protein
MASAERIKYCNGTRDSNHWAKTLLGMLMMMMKKLKPYFRKTLLKNSKDVCGSKLFAELGGLK